EPGVRGGVGDVEFPRPHPWVIAKAVGQYRDVQVGHRDRGACLDERFRCPGTDSPRATGDRDDLPLDATPLAVAGPATGASEAAAQHAALSHPRLLALIGENHTGFCTVSVSIQLTYRVVKIDDRVDPSPC